MSYISAVFLLNNCFSGPLCFESCASDVNCTKISVLNLKLLFLRNWMIVNFGRKYRKTDILVFCHLAWRMNTFFHNGKADCQAWERRILNSIVSSCTLVQDGSLKICSKKWLILLITLLVSII